MLAEYLGIRPWEHDLLTYQQWLYCRAYLDAKLRAAQPPGTDDN